MCEFNDLKCIEENIFIISIFCLISVFSIPCLFLPIWLYME